MSDMSIQAGMPRPIATDLKLKTPKLTGEEEQGSFASTLADSLKEVNSMQHKGDRAIEDLVTGRTKNIHETMITLGKAEIALKLTTQIRNKVMEAYKEVMNTAV